MKVTERIEDVSWRSWALKEIATEMVKAGMVEEAREVFQKSWQDAQESVKFDQMWQVAQAAASSGSPELAVKFAKSISGERTKGLPEVLDALVEGGYKSEFLQLLPLCSWAMATAFHACKCLIRLYPSHAQNIANLFLSC